METKKAPLIVHIIHQLGVGGLENGLVNLINSIPPNRYRHAIICLKDYTSFRNRITRNDVEVFSLNKQEGHDFKLYIKLYKIIRQLKPDILHTRNLATLEAQLVGAAAGVKKSVHGEHGRDIFDPEGKSRKYNLFRKIIYPLASHFIVVSKDLENWLQNTLGVSPSRITQIYNGVDSKRFHPTIATCPKIGPEGFITEDTFVIGSVGRMEAIKDYPSLVKAFLSILRKTPETRKNLRLMIIGEGSSRRQCIDMLREAQAENLAWLPGEQKNIPDLMRAMNLFVLPSIGEGISNTILEAMSSGLPVVATNVGGNVELIKEGYNGKLVSLGNITEMAEAISTYYTNPDLTYGHGKAARQLVVTNFDMDTMVNAYVRIYDKVLHS